MKNRFLCFAIGIMTLALTAQGQTPPRNSTSAIPRTSDGKPNLQGFWSNNMATPLERPKELAGRPTLTDAELTAMKKKAHELFAGSADAAFGDNVFLSVYANVTGTKIGFKSTDGETGDYSSVWTVERDWDNRTSQITDPSDGRIPAMTTAAKKTRETMFAALQVPAKGPEDRSFSERCITYGSPQLTQGYQSYYQIVQTPSSVVIMTEMIHDARVIRLDGVPHPSPSVQQWQGDSVGHWEGDTLVVDTTNYKPRAFMAISTAQLRVTERFSNIGNEGLRYEISINDPGAWEKPWSLMIPLKQSPHQVYEYACHEGNTGLMGILAGARADEAAAAGKQSRK